MPRSVYSEVDRGGPPRLSSINLVKRFAVGVMAMALALLGTATMAGALTTATVSSVSFTPASTALRAGQTGTWTVDYTPSAALAANDVVNLAFPAGTTFTSTTPIITATGTATAATATVSGSNVAVTITTASATQVASTFTVAGVINPAAGVYGGSSFSVNVNGGTSTSPSSGTTIYVAALASPTVVANGNGKATVSFTADGASNSVETTYTVSASPNSGVTVCTALSNSSTLTGTQTCAVSGLTVGSAYTFSVVESGGSDPITTPATSTAFIASSALATPTAAVFGSGQVMVTFQADGVATLYSVTSSPAGGVCAVGGTATSPGVSTLTGSVNCLVTGLTNGTSYTFTVTPSGDNTTSTVSAASNAVVPGPILATPTALNAGVNSSAADQANVSFTADGVATLYTVSATASGQTTEYCYVANGSTPLTGTQNCTVGGLANGVTYTFTVTPSGNGTTTLPSSTTLLTSATPSGPLVANAGYGAVKVTFAAGGVDTTYTVTSSTGNFICTVAGSTPPQGLQSCTVTGLANNTSYTFTVTGSASGVAPVTSSASVAIVTSSALATPTVAAAGPGAIKVSFTADGVATVYTVTSSPAVAGATCQVVNTTTPPTGAQSCTVTGLNGGVAYTFTVTPSGNGTTSTASLPSGAIVAPAGLAAPTATSAGSGMINVAFVADGVASTYVVTSTPGGLTCTVVNTTTPPTGAQNCTVTGLTNGTSYTFTVTASGNGSTSGTSPASNAVVAGSSITTPTVATAGSGAVNVTFTADGVAFLYTVQAYTAAAPTVPVAGAVCYVGNTTTPPTGSQNCTVTGLTNGVSYVFGVTPSGNNTSSGPSAKSAAITPSAALATPTVANAGSGAIKVSFMADGVASTYVVTSTPSVAGATCVIANTVTPPSGAQSCTVTGLTNGVTYTFTVTPSGNGTSSTASTSASIMVGAKFLTAPTVSWAASGAALVTFTPDGVASTYVVQSTPAVVPAGVTAANGTCMVANSSKAPTGTQSCTVSGLTNGVSYTFTVTPSGNGTTSLVSPASLPFMVTASVAPSAPTGVTTTVTANSIVVSWTAAAANGSPLTGYNVTATAGNVTTTCGTVAATATSCTIAGLKAGTAYSINVTAVNANGPSTAATASATTSPAPVPHPPFTTGTHGVAMVGRTVTLTISGGNFFGQPRVTSNAAGVRVGVSHDTGTLLTVIVTTPANSAKGWHTFTLTFANGKVARANYLVK